MNKEQRTANDDGSQRYYNLAEAIEAGVDYYDDDDGILQRVDERIEKDIQQ